MTELLNNNNSCCWNPVCWGGCSLYRVIVKAAVWSYLSFAPLTFYMSLHLPIKQIRRNWMKDWTVYWRGSPKKQLKKKLLWCWRPTSSPAASVASPRCRCFFSSSVIYGCLAFIPQLKVTEWAADVSPRCGHMETPEQLRQVFSCSGVWSLHSTTSLSKLLYQIWFQYK